MSAIFGSQFFKNFRKNSKRERINERVSRASEPQVILAESIPVPSFNTKRKRFQRVKSVSSPNLLETALSVEER